MFRIFRSVVILAAVFAAAPAAFAATLKEDMVVLDRAAIPALSILNRDEPELARHAMDRLTQHWGRFAAQYVQQRPGDAQWQADFRRIDALLADANRIVASGKERPKAREALKDLRRVLLQIREREKMPYYLDHLTRFHDVMEDMVLLVKDKTSDTLSAADVEKIKAAFVTADRLWAAAAAAKVDPEFGLGAAQQGELSKRVAKESQALADLGRALRGTDRQALIAMVQGIRSPFGATLSLFGDWTDLKG